MVPYLESAVSEWLAPRVHIFEPDLKCRAVEYRIDEGNIYDGDATGRYGFVDLWCYKRIKRSYLTYLVEVKRHATTSSIDQVKRYVDWWPPFGEVRGVIAAPTFSPKALQLIESDPLLDYWHIGVGGYPYA